MPEIDLQDADDAAIIVQRPTEEECVAAMHKKLEKVGEWVERWQLPLNLEKCEYVFFTRDKVNRRTTEYHGWTPKGEDGIKIAGTTLQRVGEGTGLWKKGLRPGMKITATGKGEGRKRTDTEEGKRQMREMIAAENETGRVITIEAEQLPHVRLQGAALPYNSHPEYLGIRYDEQLRFTQHAEEIGEKMTDRISTIGALSGTSWGCGEKTLRQTYQAIAVTTVEYATAAWRPYIDKTCADKLEKLHNRAIRIITG
eukprot:gene4841-9606_t